MRHSAAGVTTEAFPHQIKVGGVDYALTTISSRVRRAMA
jgi:ATP-dependent helicase HrpA